MLFDSMRFLRTLQLKTKLRTTSLDEEDLRSDFPKETPKETPKGSPKQRAKAKQMVIRAILDSFRTAEADLFEPLKVNWDFLEDCFLKVIRRRGRKRRTDESG